MNPSEGDVVEVAPDLTLPVAPKAKKASRQLPGRIYQAIDDEKGKQKLKEVLEHGTITVEENRNKLVDIAIDLPGEAAEKLIEDVAKEHGLEVEEVAPGKLRVTGPNGTIWMSRSRSDNQPGAQVQVKIPGEDGVNLLDRSIKMTFKGRKK